MAITVDYLTKIISIPQADITFVTGTLYELDTDWFRLQLKAIEASTDGMPFQDMHLHNTEVTVAGTTFFRTIEIINGFSVEFIPDAQWSVRLAGSNNNIFDVENNILVQNQVQVIAQNSAGGIVVETGTSGLTPTESAQLTSIDSTTQTMDTTLTSVDSTVTNMDATLTALDATVTAMDATVTLMDGTVTTLRKLLMNKMETDPITGVLTIYDDDDIAVLLTANIYEDVLASQIYRGRGLERRDRLT